MMKVMQVVSSLFLVISGIVLILSILIISFPYLIKPVNTYLGNFSNVISYFTLMFAAFALLVASLAYRTAILRPKLKLRIGTWLYEKEGLALSVNPKSKIVSDCAPLTSWHFHLVNNGHISAKYPMVQIIFESAFFPEDAFPGWNAVHHAHALGWYGFQWSPGNSVLVYQGLPIKLPPMYFSGKQIGDPTESDNSTETEDNMQVEITIVADGIEKQTYTLPVWLEYSSNEE
jgi:hypothetical protein